MRKIASLVAAAALPLSQVRVFCLHSRPLRLPPLHLPDRVRVLKTPH